MKTQESKQDLEKEMFELEQQLDIPSNLRWHNSKPKQETLEEAAELALVFHNTYEKLAPSFGYETRQDTKEFDFKSNNGRLMVAVCSEVIKWQQEQDKNKYSAEEVVKFGQWLSEFNNLDNESEYVIKELLRTFKNN